MEVVIFNGINLFRIEINLSQIINRNMIILTNEINDPIEEIMFHVEYASG